MNYYPHHIGDYLKSTAHLNFIEDAAYTRLLRKYYEDEAPLPNNIRALQRLMRANTRAEKAVIELILNEFFTLDETENVWRNRRADAVIHALRTANLPRESKGE